MNCYVCAKAITHLNNVEHIASGALLNNSSAWREELHASGGGHHRQLVQRQGLEELHVGETRPRFLHVFVRLVGDDAAEGTLIHPPQGTSCVRTVAHIHTRHAWRFNTLRSCTRCQLNSSVRKQAARIHRIT